MARLANHNPSNPIMVLPHPYLTPYYVTKTTRPGSSDPVYQLKAGKAQKSHVQLQNDDLFLSEPEDVKSSDRPVDSNNTAWARARRSPAVTVSWSASASTPTLAHLWLVVYIVVTVRPQEEVFRLRLDGGGSASASKLAQQLKNVGLAIAHPEPRGPSSKVFPGQQDELVVLRSAFWQGAGSPFGPRPVWTPDTYADDEESGGGGLAQYPSLTLDYTMADEPGTALCWHPRRAAKPRPGAVIYSRYVPHLGENFSMVALDYENPEHLGYFHAWQNDPRVSQGWNETGTLEQHREYLRRAHEDPHQFTVLARFDDVYFAYFEMYWGKEDRLGAYYAAHDFDRGRHSLVGDVRFRGPHRVSAWWSSQMHYLFLDDPRTMAIVGEPKYTNTSVLTYDFIHGFGVDKFVDLPHKRSGFMRCSRERFFQLCPLAENDKVVGGTNVGLVPKL